MEEIDAVIAADDVPAERLHLLNEKFYSIDYLLAGGADSDTEYSGSRGSSSSSSSNSDHGDNIEIEKDDDDDDDSEIESVGSDIDNDYASGKKGGLDAGGGGGGGGGGTSMSRVAASRVISLSRKYARDNAATVLARADVLAATIHETQGSAAPSTRTGLLERFIANAAASWAPSGKGSDVRAVEEEVESEEEGEGQLQGGGGGGSGSVEVDFEESNTNAGAGAGAGASSHSRPPPFYDACSDAADAAWATTAGVRTLSCAACFSVLSRAFQRDDRAPRGVAQWLLTTTTTTTTATTTTTPSIGVNANMSVLLPASELGVRGAHARGPVTAASSSFLDIGSLSLLSPPSLSASRPSIGLRRGREEADTLSPPPPPPPPPRAFHPLLCIACGTEVGGLSADEPAVMIVTAGIEDGMTLE